MNDSYLPVAFEGDIPRGLGLKLANLLGAGRLDRLAAQGMRMQALEALKAADAKLATAKASASAALTEFHKYKTQVYDEQVEEFSRTYEFVGQPARSVYAAVCESSKVEMTLEGPRPTSAPSRMASTICGICAGAALGSALSYGLVAGGVVGTAFAPALIGALVVIPAFAIVMWSGVREGAKQRTAARRFLGEMGQHVKTIDGRCHELRKIPPRVLSMKRVIADMKSTLSSTVEEVLEPVLADSFNACKLLMDILDTPLLDGEGAFLDGVVEKLHGHRAAIGEMREKLAA